MEYAQLGRTGLKVSKLCLGTMNFGPHTSQADSFSIMDKALDLGINFFDTANVYGAGHSERVLSRAIARRRSHVVIATKFNSVFDETTRQVTGADASPEGIRKTCEESLRRLNTDYIDLYQFHDNDYPAEKAAPIRETLEKLVQAGKIRAYGWSTDYVDKASP